MLRPYQVEGKAQLRDCYRSGLSAPLYVLPTGGGKTYVFCDIARGIVARSKRAVIVVHRQELLFQASRSLQSMGVEHGLIAPGFREGREPIAVASAQTLARRLKKASPAEIAAKYDFDLIILDEAHHAVAGTWRQIIAALPNAKLLGVTATPCRSDSKGLGAAAGGVFDAMVLGPTIQELTEQGYLAPATVYAPPVRFDRASMKAGRGDFKTADAAEKVDKPKITGDAVAHYARLIPFKPAIAFCLSVEHAEHVAAEFNAAGFIARSIDGTMADGERKGLIAALASGKIHVLTSCDIISEGTDIPVVMAAILLRPTQSTGLFLQQVGRALRPIYAEGFDLSAPEGRRAAIAAGPKPRAIILDHVGNCGPNAHGLPDDDREWTLEGGLVERRKSEKPAERARQCGGCYAYHHPAPQCPYCGFIYGVAGREIETVAGELRELTEEEKQAIRASRKKEEKKARTLPELIELGRQRGYANPEFWAEKTILARRNAAARYKTEYYERTR